MFRLLGRYLHQSYFVVSFSIGIIMGVIIAVVWKVNFFVSVFWVWIAVLLLIVSYFSPKVFFLIITLFSGMVLAFNRVAGELNGADYVRKLYGKNVLVSGVVDGDPSVDEAGVKVKINKLRFGKEDVLINGNIYLALQNSIEIQRSDEITVLGKMSEGFGVYAGYMHKPRILKILRPEPGDIVLEIRNWFAERVRNLIPDPEVSLGLSYLLGMKTGLPKDLSEHLRVVGLVHVVVASGAHLSILVEFARKIFGRWSRFAGVFFSGLLVIAFMAVVGWTPSILRAGIMSILTLIMWYVGRKIVPWRLIVMVMALTLMINPMFVIDLGWLLSFASYAGIMIVGPKLVKFFYGAKDPGFVGSMVLVTLSATIMTLPITLYYYGIFSLISIVANLLILPTLSIAMGLVFMVGVVMGVPGLEKLIGFLATKLLGFHILIVEWLGGMREFLIEIPINQIWVFGLYLIITVLMLPSVIRKKCIKKVHIVD